MGEVCVEKVTDEKFVSQSGIDINARKIFFRKKNFTLTLETFSDLKKFIQNSGIYLISIDYSYEVKKLCYFENSNFILSS